MSDACVQRLRDALCEVEEGTVAVCRWDPPGRAAPPAGKAAGERLGKPDPAMAGQRDKGPVAVAAAREWPGGPAAAAGERAEGAVAMAAEERPGGVATAAEKRVGGQADDAGKCTEERAMAVDEVRAGQAATAAAGALRALAEGRGRIEIYPLFPGAEIAFHRYLAEAVRVQGVPRLDVLELHHCRSGRVRPDTPGGAFLSLGPGDTCLYPGGGVSGRLSLPLGYYEGLSFSFDLRELSRRCPPAVAGAGIDFSGLLRSFQAQEGPLVLPAGSALDPLLFVLYDLPPRLRVPYCALKAQELLLYLSRQEPGRAAAPVSQQTELVREIREFLISHPERRVTVEELARRYPINASSLKAAFKSVYGLPVGAYMREYRIRRAADLLRDTDESIAAIARQMGYTSQGKFTRAFKELTGTLPSKYRRRHQNGPA